MDNLSIALIATIGAIAISAIICFTFYKVTQLRVKREFEQAVISNPETAKYYLKLRETPANPEGTPRWPNTNMWVTTEITTTKPQEETEVCDEDR